LNKPRPLAERLRPISLNQIIGQHDAVKLLRSFIHRGDMPSLVFWGPPGSGKTTLCRVLARELIWDSASINATSASVKDIRKLAERAECTWEQWEKRTVVFIDEIHRLNKAQQDVLLPFIEDGTFVLLGSTTENPFFSLNQALRSRIQLVNLLPISAADTMHALSRAIDALSIESCSEEILEWLSIRSSGDLRLAYSAIEGAVFIAEANQREVSLEDVACCLGQTGVTGDRGDNHYDLASAYQKSLRGSDANAAIYYLARFLLSGEDPRFIARRLMVTASEDVGCADPQAFILSEAAYAAVEKLGMPEARIPLAEATIYVANAPKSNLTIDSIDSAMRLIKENSLPGIPAHLKDRHYPGGDHAAKYISPHKHADSNQSYLPVEVRQEFISQAKANETRYQDVVRDHLLQDNKQDWAMIDVNKLADSLDMTEAQARNAMNQLVKNGELLFRRQFKMKTEFLGNGESDQ